MKKIKLTEKNINTVCGMLKKFFNNPNNGFIDYHNFDCGYKNIKPYGGIGLNQNIDNIEVVNDCLFNNIPFIRITFQEGVSGTVFDLGSIFLFKGNEIIVQSKWKFTDCNYIYNVYRLIKLSENDILKIQEIRENERQIAEEYYDSYWYNDEII